MNRRFLKTAPLVLLLGAGGFYLWTQTGRYFPVDRQLVWPLPSQPRDIRQFEAQVWQDGQLLKREVRRYPSGMSAELVQPLALKDGEYDFKAIWKRDGASAEESWSKTLSVTADSTVVLSMPFR